MFNRYPVKSPRAKSHPTKIHLGQKSPETKRSPIQKSLQNNLPPEPICPTKQFAFQTDLPCLEGVLVTEAIGFRV